MKKKTMRKHLAAVFSLVKQTIEFSMRARIVLKRVTKKKNNKNKSTTTAIKASNYIIAYHLWNCNALSLRVAASASPNCLSTDAIIILNNLFWLIALDLLFFIFSSLQFSFVLFHEKTYFSLFHFGWAKQ